MKQYNNESVLGWRHSGSSPRVISRSHWGFRFCGDPRTRYAGLQLSTPICIHSTFSQIFTLVPSCLQLTLSFSFFPYFPPFSFPPPTFSFPYLGAPSTFLPPAPPLLSSPSFSTLASPTHLSLTFPLLLLHSTTLFLHLCHPLSYLPTFPHFYTLFLSFHLYSTSLLTLSSPPSSRSNLAPLLLLHSTTLSSFLSHPSLCTSLLSTSLLLTSSLPLPHSYT